MTLNEFWDNTTESETIIYQGNDHFRGGTFTDGKFLWYDDGSTCIPLDDIHSLEELMERCDVYANGKYVCCRCHKIMVKPSHRIFAGVYCDDCWTDSDQKELEWAYSHLD